MAKNQALPRLLTLAIVASTLIIALDTFAAPPARAAGNPMNTARMIINGKLYSEAWGQDVVLPTRLPDGSSGWIRFRANLTAGESERGADVASEGDPCQTASGTEQWLDKAGLTLAVYSLYQYWCYDYTQITNYTTAYDHTSAYFGWSLANHSESTTVYPPSEGLGTGEYRFNGPLGIGCVSGSIDIDFGDSGSSSVFRYYNGYYGC